MKKFKNIFACIGTGAILSTLIMLVYEVSKAYHIYFPSQINALIPVIIFATVTILYFAGNIIFTALQEWFSRKQKIITNRCYKKNKKND